MVYGGIVLFAFDSIQVVQKFSSDDCINKDLVYMESDVVVIYDKYRGLLNIVSFCFQIFIVAIAIVNWHRNCLGKQEIIWPSGTYGW